MATHLRGPLTIYVAWHPECEDGAFMAKGIYEWFRAPSQNVRRSGAGIPAYYRSQYWRETPSIPGHRDFEHFREPLPAAAAAPQADRPAIQPIDYDAADINVVIALIDEHMVVDPLWRPWLYEQATRHKQYEGSQETRDKKRAESLTPADEATDAAGSHVIFIPVQLHSSFTRLPKTITRINAIRVDHWDDEGTEDSAARQARRRRRVCRYLVQTLVRALRKDKGRSDLLSRSIFLSHAKADRQNSVGVAERIRSRALHHGQVDTFFDAAQLNWAEDWEGPMNSAAHFRTAAFIAVFSDLYSSRYWCREEIRNARSPVEIDERRQIKPPRINRNTGGQVWWVQPTVVVDTLCKSWSSLLPEMSGTPIIRWQESEAAAAEILDRVMLEALRAELQARHAFLLLRWIREKELHPQLRDLYSDLKTGSKKDSEKPPPLHFLTWTPDAHTLMEWTYPRPKKEGGRVSRIIKALVVYPGHGLDQREGSRFNHYLGEDVRFASVEELAHLLRNPTTPLTPSDADLKIEHRPLIALSVGDPQARELHALGYGPEHIDDAVYRLTTAIVAASARLAYGGVLRSTPTFLDEVFDTISLLGGHQPTDSDKPHPPTVLHCYQAWDSYLKTSIEERANYHGLCTFHNVPLEDLAPPPEAAPRALHERQKALWRSRALSEMWRQMAQQSQALLALGGKIYGWPGRAPGVLEEVCRHYEQGNQVFVLSAFGGASRALVHWLLSDQPIFELLSFEHQWQQPNNTGLRHIHAALAEQLNNEHARDNSDAHNNGPFDGHAAAQKRLEDRYQELHGSISRFRETIHADLTAPEHLELPSGLYPKELWQLMTTSSVSRIRYLLTKKVIPQLPPPVVP